MPRFKILHGKHTQKEQVGTNPDGSPVFRPVTYGRNTPKGDVVDSPSDLVAKFNSPGSTKFELIPEPARHYAPPVAAVAPTPVTLAQATAAAYTPPSKPLTDALDQMSVGDLKKFADSEEIDLKGARTKEEMIRAIRAAT